VKVYIADFDFGFIAEHNLEGELQMTFRDRDDYYSCWDVEGSFIERNKEYDALADKLGLPKSASDMVDFDTNRPSC
jgi:hypothetical protein